MSGARRRAKPASRTTSQKQASSSVSYKTQPPQLNQDRVDRIVPRAAGSLIICWLLITIALHVLAPRSWITRLDEPLRAARSVLIVTAHPDDESLMFAPAILGLRPGRQIRVLSLSNGDFEGQGERRTNEMQAACERLQISCIVIDDPALRDGPDQVWSLETIRRHVEEATPADVIVTFDAAGVSNHSNHRAVSEALTSPAFLKEHRVYTLESQPLRRHYLGPLASPINFLGSAPVLFVSDPSQYLQTRAAFAAHVSQQRWYRSLNIVASTFVWSNTLRPVP